MLVLGRNVDEKIVIGKDIIVQVVEIRGDQVKLGFTAPPEISVDRYEIWVKKMEEKRRAEGSR